jgi:hypothetical protein
MGIDTCIYDCTESAQQPPEVRELTLWAVYPKRQVWVVDSCQPDRRGRGWIFVVAASLHPDDLFTNHDPADLTSLFSLSFSTFPLRNTNYAAIAPTRSLLFPLPHLGCSLHCRPKVRTLFFGALSLATRFINTSHTPSTDGLKP